jgi:DNA-binding GntR family transcriptional regulator
VAARPSLRHSLADALRARVRAGALSPGDRLPSEPQLAQQLGVSRSSLRAAITLLEEEGVLSRRHGSGTYVTHRPVLRNELGRNFGVSTLIASTGLEPGVENASSGEEQASPEVAAALGADAVSALHRVRTANGRRVVVSSDWCRADHLSADELRGAADGSVYAALAARGLAVHHGVAHISPDTADARLAELLDVPRGALLLTIFQVDETAAGQAVLVSREHHLADAFDITVYRRGPVGDAGA